MNRTALGIVAAALLLLGVITWFRGPPDGSAAGFSGGCIRVGLVLGALWLALPQILAIARSAPSKLLGRFFGGGKKADEPDRPEQPRQPVKRPRRRSNS